MVILSALPAEAPVAFIADALEKQKVPFEMFFYKNLHSLYLEYSMVAGKITGEISFGEKSYNLSDITGIYNRAIDFSISSAYKDLDKNSNEYTALRNKYDSFQNLMELLPVRVMNHNRPMAGNGSKLYQMLMIQQCGLKTPDSLVTNKQESLEAYLNKQGTLIFKSASGIRSIVHTYGDPFSKRSIAACPVLFQKKLNGINYRVHVAGSRIFTTIIHSHAVDYRYAKKENAHVELEASTLPPEIEKACFKLSKTMDLPLAGIDLYKTDGGEWFCFEVNPSPAFSFYESGTGQPIAAAIASYLSGM